MRFSFKVIFMWAALTLSVQAATILVYGDSLSSGYGINKQKGWVSLLSQKLGSKHSVFNASQTGETSDGGLRRFDQTLDKYKPNIVILELGGNDALRGLPLAQLQTNLQTMIDKSLARKSKVILVGMALPPNFGSTFDFQFRKVYADLARKNKIPLVPLLVAGIENDLNSFLNDGIHPNETAQPRLMANVLPSVQTTLRLIKP